MARTHGGPPPPLHGGGPCGRRDRRAHTGRGRAGGPRRTGAAGRAVRPGDTNDDRPGTHPHPDRRQRGHRPVRGTDRPAAPGRTAHAHRHPGQARRGPAPRGTRRDRRGGPPGPRGPGLRGHRDPAAQRGGGQDRRGRGLLLEGARPDRLHPHRRHRRHRRRRHHGRRGLRRRLLAARSALDRRTDDRARHGRRRRRREDRHQHRRGQEPRRRLPPARRGPVRPGRAGLAAGQRLRLRHGRDHQGRLHLRPGDPRPRRGRPAGRAHTGRTAHLRADRAGHPGQGRGRLQRPQGVRTPRDPQLRPHAGPRDREERALQVAPRRRRLRRHGLRRRTGPARRTPGRRHRRPAPRRPGVRRTAAHLPRRPVAQAAGEHEGRQEVRGDLLRFIVLDGLGKPTVLEGPDPAILLAAYGEVSA